MIVIVLLEMLFLVKTLQRKVEQNQPKPFGLWSCKCYNCSVTKMFPRCIFKVFVTSLNCSKSLDISGKKPKSVSQIWLPIRRIQS